MATLREGEAFPAFDLPDGDGARATLDAYAGQPLVVYFYPKDDTPGCTSQAKDFSAFADAFGELGVAVLGVSPDPAEKHKRFGKKHGLRVRLLSDRERSLIGPLGLWVEKRMYGKAFEGVERTTVLVDGTGTVRRVWPKVRVAGHAEEVLQAARNLQENHP